MNGFALRAEATKDAAVLTSGIPGYDIEVVPGKFNAYTLALRGFLMPGWVGRLAAALAQHRISIIRGEAEKVTVSSWSSSFELKSAPFAKDPLAIDYVSLANTELPQDRAVGKIDLLDFRLETCSQHEGSLYLEVRGVDRLGFLGDLLDYFSMRCLFPVKMTVETVGNTALDRFWLKGVGGSKPSDSITFSMKENLDRLLIASK